MASQVVLAVKNPPANAGGIRDAGLTPGSRRSPGEGQGNPLQYSCLKNSVDRGAWWATVCRVTKSLTQLKQLSTHTHRHTHTHAQTHTHIYTPHFLYPFLHCFHVLAIVNNAVMSIRVPVSFQISAFGFLRCILAVELLGNMVAAAAKSLQSCPTLCDPIDGSPPGSPVPGILQARTLEWVAISFSKA